MIIPYYTAIWTWELGSWDETCQKQWWKTQAKTGYTGPREGPLPGGAIPPGRTPSIYIYTYIPIFHTWSMLLLFSWSSVKYILCMCHFFVIYYEHIRLMWVFKRFSVSTRPLTKVVNHFSVLHTKIVLDILKPPDFRCKGIQQKKLKLWNFLSIPICLLKLSKKLRKTISTSTQC